LKKTTSPLFRIAGRLYSEVAEALGVVGWLATIAEKKLAALIDKWRQRCRCQRRRTTSRRVVVPNDRTSRPLKDSDGCPPSLGRAADSVTKNAYLHLVGP